MITQEYDNFRVSSEKVNAWHVILKDYDYQRISKSLAHYVETDQTGFPPVVGQLTNRNKNRFLNFKQHRYRYAELEKQLLNTRQIGIGTTKTVGGKDGE